MCCQFGKRKDALYVLGLFCCLGFAVTEMVFTSGNVTVIGLFEINAPSGMDCGSEVTIPSVMSAEAVKWYFQKLNEANALPIKIGFEGHKTCGSASRASELAIDILSRAMSTKNGTNSELIVGIIGPKDSKEADAISPILSAVHPDARLLHIGYSTTTVGLGNADTYPNFIRVIPNDNVQIDVMVKAMAKLEWNRIAIIYENDVYGRENTMALKTKASMEDICVAYTGAIDIVNGISSTQIDKVLNDITISIHPINGFVFFGSKTTANVLFRYIDNMAISNAPVAMLSEGVELQRSVFEKDVNVVLNKAKGSYAIAPTYREITEFSEHWKQIFTDQAKFEEESQSNPWLDDVYRQVTKCSDTCPFNALSPEEVQTLFGDQSLFIQYAVVAAHAMAKGVKTLYKTYCNSTVKPCSKFFEKFRSGQMVDILKNTSLNFVEDFSWSLASLAADGVLLNIDSSGEIASSNMKPLYQLFNYRHTDTAQTRFNFVKVGDFVDGEMKINTSNIRDYDDQGTERFWPDVRKALCSDTKLCDDCIPADLTERFIHEPGDVYVIALVPVHDKSKTDLQGCSSDIRSVNSYQIAEGIRFGLKRFTSDSVYSQYFNGVKLGLIVLDTCNNPVVVQRKVLNLQKYGLPLGNGTYLDMTNKIIGYIGPLGSGISIAVSGNLQKLKKVQISYASTNPSLSDRVQHPYFMRVVTPDDFQASVMIQIIKELKGNFIQLVYSKGAYGEGGRDKVNETAYANDICVVQSIEVEDGANYYEYYERLRKQPHAKIVIIFLNSNVVEPFFKSLIDLHDHNDDFLFIGSETWSRNPDVLNTDKNKHITLGSYTIVLEMVQPDTLSTQIRNISPAPFRVNPWAMQYLQTKLNCYFPDSFDKKKSHRCEDVVAFKDDPNFLMDPWVTTAYNAMLSLLIGAGSFLKKTCGNEATSLCPDFFNNPTGLVTEIRDTAKLDLYGNGRPDNVFNKNGDGNVGYNIYNIQRDPDNPQQLVYTKVGQFPVEGSSTFDPPSGSEPASRCPNEQACSNCIRPKTTEDTLEQEDNNLNVGMLVLGILLGLACLSIVVLVIVICRLRITFPVDRDIYITPTQVSYDGYTPEGERPEAVGEHRYSPPSSCEIIQTTNTEQF